MSSPSQASHAAAFAALTGLLSLARQLRDSKGASPAALEQLQASTDELDLQFLLDEVPKALDQASEGLQRVARIDKVWLRTAA